MRSQIETTPALGILICTTTINIRMNSTIFPKMDVCLPKDCFIMVMSSCIILFTACHVINFPLIWDNKSAEK